MRMAYPMEATLWYIEQLKKSNDIMALEYIAEAVQDAIRNTNTGHTEIHWEFTPYNLDEWNNAEERVLFVGSEPNGNNPHPDILDMGQWFRTACEENNYLGGPQFYKRCEIMLEGLGVGFSAFRFMDLKAVGGGAQAGLLDVERGCLEQSWRGVLVFHFNRPGFRISAAYSSTAWGNSTKSFRSVYQGHGF